MKIHKYVGLDVHSDTAVIPVAAGERTSEVRLRGKSAATMPVAELGDVRRLALAACWAVFSFG